MDGTRKKRSECEEFITQLSPVLHNWPFVLIEIVALYWWPPSRPNLELFLRRIQQSEVVREVEWQEEVERFFRFHWVKIQPLSPGMIGLRHWTWHDWQHHERACGIFLVEDFLDLVDKFDSVPQLDLPQQLSTSLFKKLRSMDD